MKTLSDLKDDVPLREQLELDSMDFLDIVMELRKRYRVQIPEDDYIQLATLDSTVEYLEPRMKDAEATGITICTICTTRSSSARACRGWPPGFAWPITAAVSAFSSGTTTIGGLNSFYRLDGRNYDVGLHAVTNFTPKGAGTVRWPDCCVNCG